MSLVGVYQWSGLEKISKWDIVQLISKQLNLPIDHLTEVAGPSPGGVTRPRDVEMDRSKLTDKGIKHQTDFNTGFMKCLQPFLWSLATYFQYFSYRFSYKYYFCFTCYLPVHFILHKIYFVAIKLIFYISFRYIKAFRLAFLVYLIYLYVTMI